MQHRKKYRFSQCTRLFCVYGTLILFVLIVLFSYIYYYNRQNVLKEAAVKQTNICASVRASVKTELDNLSTISLNLVYSSAIRTNFSSFVSYTGKTNQSKEDILRSRDNAKAIYDVITAMIGSYQSASQVNLYTMDGTRVSSGYQQSVTKADLSSISWWKNVTALHGSKFIALPETNIGLPASGPNRDEHKFLSMARLFYNEQEQPEGVFEVVQDCNTVFSLAAKMEDTNSGLKLYVYNDRGELVYPYTSVSPHADYLALVKDNKLADEKSSMVAVSSKSSQFLTKDTVPEYGWTIIAAESKSTVYDSLANFRITFFILAALIFAGTLLVCYVLAKKMNQPLIKLTKATKKLTLDRVLDDSKKALTLADSNIFEISDLCSSFLKMYEQLRESSRDLLLARSEEIRANMQATQSLINPHFLYNSLTCISILAEDGENETAVRMCNTLCDYFRYTADSTRTHVSIREEMDCTQKYITCMQIRFGEAFSYSIQISPEAENVCIPKLIVQPLVENAFKYAFNSTPPWELRLYAEVDEENWKIRVEDNGGSLSDADRERIFAVLHEMDYSQELHNMQIGGMGLKNIYIRLALQYGKAAIFEIDNSVNNKTIFTIGGPVRRKAEENNATD